MAYNFGRTEVGWRFPFLANRFGTSENLIRWSDRRVSIPPRRPKIRAIPSPRRHGLLLREFFAGRVSPANAGRGARRGGVRRADRGHRHTAQPAALVHGNQSRAITRFNVSNYVRRIDDDDGGDLGRRARVVHGRVVRRRSRAAAWASRLLFSSGGARFERARFYFFFIPPPQTPLSEQTW